MKFAIWMLVVVVRDVAAWFVTSVSDEQVRSMAWVVFFDDLCMLVVCEDVRKAKERLNRHVQLTTTTFVFLSRSRKQNKLAKSTNTKYSKNQKRKDYLEEGRLNK